MMFYIRTLRVCKYRKCLMVKRADIDTVEMGGQRALSDH